MSDRHIITLTTDFGVGSPYVAEMKAAILRLCPAVRLIDITHAVPAQDIRYGAVVLHDVTVGFPAETIHVAVVDPGVGTARTIVYAKMGDQRYVAPNNGLLSLLASERPCGQLWTLDNQAYWNHPVSSTFHGRDIMAPVAARLALGVRPDQLGSPLDQLEAIDWAQPTVTPHSVSGQILIVDSFGNLVTNIHRAMLPPQVPLADVSVRCRGVVCHPLCDTYGNADPGQVMALFGSSHRLEIAVNQGSAAREIAASVGDEVVVTWANRH
jgi:S-adenosylmethionine hydrolase